MQRWFTVGCLLLLLGVGLLPTVAVRAAESRPAQVATAAPQAAPSTAPAVAEREIRAQLTPKRYTTLAAEVGAKIQSLPIPEGGSFKAGQTLVSFDCSLQQAQAQKARAAQEAADATLKSTTRLSELNSAGKLELELAQTEAAKARADVSFNTVMLSKCRVAAPFAGRVSEQRVREQQYVQPGQPLLEIIDDSTLELEFIAPSQWMTLLKVNSPFEIRIDETGRNYPATIVRTAARVDPVSQSVKFVGAIRGRFPDLIAGMSGRVIVPQPQPAAVR
ncbi:efflux RND transporter periplasmic adaptor subunit [Ideonella sp.]|uniref:efflux RND transporter periplasmic adaptor subunit n=1 Tax=Ideonella sp. TaxID=1929293 RepID=UPI0035B342B3